MNYELDKNIKRTNLETLDFTAFGVFVGNVYWLLDCILEGYSTHSGEGRIRGMIIYWFGIAIIRKETKDLYYIIDKKSLRLKGVIKSKAIKIF